MQLGESNQNYITLIQALKDDKFGELRPDYTHFVEFQKAATEVLRALNDNGQFKAELPEFAYQEDSFTGEFSRQFSEIIALDFDYLEYVHITFNNVFLATTEFENIHLTGLDFLSHFMSKQACEIVLKKEFQGLISSELMINLNSGLQNARKRWSYALNGTLSESSYDCWIYRNNDDFSFIDCELFGDFVFIHHTGKVLERKIVNGKEEYIDIGLFLINENGEYADSDAEDIEKLGVWILEQYKNNPDAPPYNQKDKEARPNKKSFIEYAYNLFTNKNTPKDEKLNINKRDIIKAWNEVLPPKHECKWKNAGTRNHIKSAN